MATKTHDYASDGIKLCADALNKVFPDDRFVKYYHSSFMYYKTAKHLKFDFYNEELKIAVIFYGRHHYEYIPIVHGKLDNYEIRKEKDAFRENLCRQLGIHLIIIAYTNQTKEDMVGYIRNSISHM